MMKHTSNGVQKIQQAYMMNEYCDQPIFNQLLHSNRIYGSYTGMLIYFSKLLIYFSPISNFGLWFEFAGEYRRRLRTILQLYSLSHQLECSVNQQKTIIMKINLSKYRKFTIETMTHLHPWMTKTPLQNPRYFSFVTFRPETKKIYYEETIHY